jgi:6-phospho-beta-glucosidase
MKFSVLGGGGIRSPFLAKSIVGCAKELGVTEVAFMDTDREKLNIYGALSKQVAAIVDSSVSFITTTDPVEALRDADCVITALRVGGDESRVKDEKIALAHNVLGQETTGAGGFAMAMRSIPVISAYMRLIRQYAHPDCLVFNFTNPAGLVTGALVRQGYDNVIGICDNPHKQKEEFAKVLQVDENDVTTECYGLNHLSWFRSVRIKGVEAIDKLLDNPGLYSDTEMRFFDPNLLKWSRTLPNGYLYYYYNREEAVSNIQKSRLTRGEVIRDLNEEMNASLSGMDIEADFERAGLAYLTFLLRRENSYMQIESGVKLRNRQYGLDKLTKPGKSEGYAGVALNIVRALRKRGAARNELEMIVKNKGALPFLADDDTVEVTCRVDGDIKPLNFGEVPLHQRTLITQMKAYENLAIDAILSQDRQTAAIALMTNPLVNSYTLAKKLLEEYLAAHGKYLPAWR